MPDIKYVNEFMFFIYTNIRLFNILNYILVFS